MTTYTGSCHCGKIAFEADGNIGPVIECNCTHCRRKGLLLWFVDADAFRLKTPRETISTYLFHRHAIRHRFCPTCGCQPFAESEDADGKLKIAINVRCIPDVDLASLQRVPYDGLHKL